MPTGCYEAPFLFTFGWKLPISVPSPSFVSLFLPRPGLRAERSTLAKHLRVVLDINALDKTLTYGRYFCSVSGQRMPRTTIPLTRSSAPKFGAWKGVFVTRTRDVGLARKGGERSVYVRWAHLAFQLQITLDRAFLREHHSWRPSLLRSRNAFKFLSYRSR
jgi:hypothetical protein